MSLCFVISHGKRFERHFPIIGGALLYLCQTPSRGSTWISFAVFINQPEQDQSLKPSPPATRCFSRPRRVSSPGCSGSSRPSHGFSCRARARAAFLCCWQHGTKLHRRWRIRPDGTSCELPRWERQAGRILHTLEILDRRKLHERRRRDWPGAETHIAE